jgi:hypothetical protein
MNPERLQLKGLLAESKKNYRRLDTEASGILLIVRSLLNPYENIAKLDIEKCSVLIERLLKITQEMKDLQIKIKDLEQEFE